VTKRIAVIGAGLAGLACARVFSRSGAYVEIFEQDRIVGGRMATTRMGIVPYDHGAQYLTARSAQFRGFIDELCSMGYAASWKPKTSQGEGGGQILPWHVGAPGMSSIVRPLAESVRIHTSCRVHTIERTDKAWHVWFDDETILGPFAAVAIAVPAPQAQLMLGRVEEVSAPLSRVRMSPCWSLMVRLDQRMLPNQDVFSDMSDVIRWIARSNANPGRTLKGETIVVYASPQDRGCRARNRRRGAVV
jgi:predicted NAD/FAD-dependent oxidoreductase